MNEKREIKLGRFVKFVGENMFCKLCKDFTEMEKRYLESVLEEAIMKNGIHVSRHCLKRLKQRNYSMGKLQMVVRNGEIREVQLDKDGCRVLLSFASASQFGKGFTSYCVYSLTDGAVMSVWQRQNYKEKRIDSETYRGRKSYLQSNVNVIPAVNVYLDIENDSIMDLMFKYDRSPLNKKDKKQLHKIVEQPTTTERIFENWG